MIHMFNGHVISVTIDDDPVARAPMGILSLQLEGNGQIWYRNVYLKQQDKSLDFTFNSMSRVRIPIWSDVFEALRNEIVTTTVRGTVSEPDVSTRPLTTTGAVIGSLFGAERDFRDGTSLQRAEHEARAERRRIHAIME